MLVAIDAVFCGGLGKSGRGGQSALSASTPALSKLASDVAAPHVIYPINHTQSGGCRYTTHIFREKPSRPFRLGRKICQIEYHRLRSF